MAKLINKLRNSAPGILLRREYWRLHIRKLLKKYSDYEYVKKQYEAMGRPLNLADPKRYTEKLQWLKIFWRDDLARIVSDKYEVRKYIEKIGHPELLNELIAVYESVDDFDPKTLPDQFVLKASHGSGWNLIVKDKSKVNWFWWRKIMRSWMKQNLYWYGREWNYEKQKPRIIVEKYLEDDSGELRDYKIICTNGAPRFMQIDENRATNHKRIYVDENGKKLNLLDSQNCEEHLTVQFGDTQKKMFELAKEFSKPFPNVRVDFYCCNNKIYFGELTFFGGSGFYSFDPDEFDFYCGDLLTLPAPNHNLELYNQLQNTNND